MKPHRLLPLAVFLLLARFAAALPGDIVWNFGAGADVYSSPALKGQVAYFGTSQSGTDTASSRIIAVSWATGSPVQKWARTMTDWMDSSPALSADGTTLFIGSWDNTLYAVYADTGASRWTYSTASYILASPAVGSDGTVYVASADGSVYALNPSALTALTRLKWSYLCGDAIEASPAIAADGTIVVATLSGEVVALDPSGNLKWSFTVDSITDRDSRIKASPVIASDGTVYIGSGNYFFYALDGATGALKWSFETAGEVDSSAAIGPEGNIYFASRAGDFYAVDSDGVLAWGDYLGDIYFSSTAIDADGNVYIPYFAGNNTSTIAAFTSSGDLLWQTNLPTVIDASPILTGDGLLLIGGYNNRLYALETDVGAGTEGWPKFRRDFSNTGRNPPGLAPTITAGPASAIRLAGQPFTLAGSATGTSPLVYVWRRHGAVLPGDGTATLTLGAVTPADAGDYDLFVYNAFGSATSASVPLTVGGTLTATPDHATWTIRRPVSAAATVSVEQSPDLSAWDTTGVTTQVTATDSDDVQTLEASAPAPTGRVFLRLAQPTP